MKQDDGLWAIPGVRLFTVLLCGTALAVGALVVKPAADAKAHRRAFDAAVWRAHPDDSGTMWPTRLCMVDDLVARQVLRGLVRQQIEALLGPPDGRGMFADWSLVYHLGPERSLIRIDSEWLVIRLDASQRATDYRIVSD